MISGGTLLRPQRELTIRPSNMLALEAYNRSEASDIAYDHSAAVTDCSATKVKKIYFDRQGIRFI
jgi:hypothetical protein